MLLYFGMALIAGLSTWGIAQTNPQVSADVPRVHLSEAAISGFRMRYVPPIYPPAAKKDRIEGDVILRILIGTRGSVSVLAVVSGNRALQDAAKQAVAQWIYEPYTTKDQICEVVTLAHVRFRLPAKSGTIAQ
jgi:TonB family protein